MRVEQCVVLCVQWSRATRDYRCTVHLVDAPVCVAWTRIYGRGTKETLFPSARTFQFCVGADIQGVPNSTHFNRVLREFESDIRRYFFAFTLYQLYNILTATMLIKNFRSITKSILFNKYTCTYIHRYRFFKSVL